MKGHYTRIYDSIIEKEASIKVPHLGPLLRAFFISILITLGQDLIRKPHTNAYFQKCLVCENSCVKYLKDYFKDLGLIDFKGTRVGTKYFLNEKKIEAYYNDVFFQNEVAKKSHLKIAS